MHQKAFLLTLSICLLFIKLIAQYNPAYARQIRVTNVIGDTSVFVAKLDINTEELITAGKMKPDGSDIRFTPNTCISQNNYNSYFIEKGINTPHTTIWIRVQSVNPNVSKNIIMYYGDSLATAASNFATTFVNSFITSGTGTNTIIPSRMRYDWIEIKAGDTLTYSTADTILHIWAERLIINGVLRADGMGFQAPVTANTNGNGPGGGTVSPAGNSGSGGGSYASIGGEGGKDNNDTPGQGGAIYGDLYAATQFSGSSGGNTMAQGSVGGAGGGGIIIDATDIVIGAQGMLASNGYNGVTDSSGHGGGGGSGGTMRITVDSLHVSGTISVAGGNGANGNNTGDNDGGGGGSGGRIIVYATAIENNGAVFNYVGGEGGEGGNESYGQSGGYRLYGYVKHKFYSFYTRL